MTNIFIANLDFGITSEDLKATFSQFGEVSYAHVVYDKKTKKSRGFGYVEMEDTDQAIAAIQALNGVEVNGRALDVKIASPKGSRPDNQKKPTNNFKDRPKRTFNADRDNSSREESEQKRVMRPRRKRI
ncbi:RNA-binding protein [Lishizhenia sp.]|uniref:RNA recognition motif domain-containing protein n=1 Tax=Lishizhenia sp. TaxID=2497594 RepID=UPI00299E3912|nr:RNA-binding protein [Lishizhenia sp.]MDX1445101.1 RNA-binding protein [Lishizhenia sp.]